MMSYVDAVVKPGYRVGSGTSDVDPRFNEDGGTIRLQIPVFKQHGFDMDAYFGGQVDTAYVCGTLGLDIAPLAMTILQPEHHLVGVRWTHKHDKEGAPPFQENFYLSPASVRFADKNYRALLYIPAPETKPAHFHPPTTIEVIAAPVPGIGYGDRVRLAYNPAAIRLC